MSRAGDIRKSINERKKRKDKTGDIHNCCGNTVVEVIYPINAITAKQNLFETLLMPFSIMAKITFMGQSALIIANGSCKWASGV